MPNINKIKLSGTSYDIQDANATKTVELTQAQYDALVTGGTVDSNTFYIITDGEMFNPSGKVDTSAFTEFSGAVETELSGKTDESAFTAHTGDSTIHVTTAQTAAWNAKSDFSGSYNDLTNKLSAGTNITIVDNVISAEGGGKAVSGGTNISITTGETADTINCTLPMSTDSVKKIVVDSNYSSFVTSDAVITANSLSNNILIGNNTFNIKGIIKGNINNNLIIGSYNTSRLTNGTKPTLEGNLAVGSNNTINSACSLLVGNNSTISRSYQFAIGYKQHPNNEYETSLGKYNVSSSASATFGDSGNTLFSVGNGTSESARHNAFEIRQNGDIYLTLDGQDVKLQDQLGGGEVSSAITSGDTNAVAGGAVYDKFDEVEQVTAAALNNINDRVSEDEEVTAAGLNALNDKFGGLKLVKLTQTQYDNLQVKDQNTLYVIV